jgi:hypothetical protein
MKVNLWINAIQSLNELSLLNRPEVRRQETKEGLRVNFESASHGCIYPLVKERIIINKLLKTEQKKRASKGSFLEITDWIRIDNQD